MFVKKDLVFDKTTGDGYQEMFMYHCKNEFATSTMQLLF